MGLSKRAIKRAVLRAQTVEQEIKKHNERIAAEEAHMSSSGSSGYDDDVVPEVVVEERLHHIKEVLVEHAAHDPHKLRHKIAEVLHPHVVRPPVDIPEFFQGKNACVALVAGKSIPVTHNMVTNLRRRRSLWKRDLPKIGEDKECILPQQSAAPTSINNQTQIYLSTVQ
ncbi:hypothetical protein DYB25_005860 [Aphanomyces astaci]|uniref:Uncharacterized protein n=1 Tax=Aphanomyces astaci TaxID=112090 RepID=A0A397F284_APHAT|nr:hypothetical protein DYB25_005860 [Aphanomyces astaci]RHY13771.1 hypothetical protein DYB36_004598 [Aphanomyces astaci]RHY63884.1 hypothetical protein DYB38_006402 [Aphanomyces astaci]RHY74365.1 hypothetical protein DYB34_000086 [Aphanomyces astaci]RHZ07279.1 hypothetical protein DYB31_001105 [Aphanomyces astaci]